MSSGIVLLGTSPSASLISPQETDGDITGLAQTPSSTVLGSALKAQTNSTHQVWIFDTGASHHITADFLCLSAPVSRRVGITVGGGKVLYSTHAGTVRLTVEIAGILSNVSLTDVLYLPDWNVANLVSWKQIDQKGKFYLYGEKGTLDVRRKTDNTTILHSTSSTSLYTFQSVTQHGEVYLSAVQFWHEALGHSSPQIWSNASLIFADGKILPHRPSQFFCQLCTQYNSKHTNPAPLKHTATAPYDLIHTDLAGPFHTTSMGGARYHMPIIDDYSRYTESYFLKHKSDALKSLKDFCQ
jgi:hypothetical protein